MISDLGVQHSNHRQTPFSKSQVKPRKIKIEREQILRLFPEKKNKSTRPI